MIQAQMRKYHIPVMLDQCLEGLNIQPDGIYVDVTYGGGGHSGAILNRLKGGKLFAFDQDSDVIEHLPDTDKLVFINHNFQYLTNFLKYYDVQEVDGILADLGISSHQIDAGERGFSFRASAPLDMRMNREDYCTAYHVVNEYDVEALSALFKKYGEVKFAWKLAQKIVAIRKVKAIATTGELAELVEEFAPAHQRNKALAMVFQAIRIEVNREMAALESFLEQALELLKPGGRLVVMSYHSLEDRLVKQFMQSGNAEGKLRNDAFGTIAPPMRVINRKPIAASEEELLSNPRSRSAKLRIAEKV